MTNFEYKVLKYIEQNRSVYWETVLKSFPGSQINEVDSALKCLLKKDLIEKAWGADKPPQCTIRISEQGRLFLLDNTQANDENCKGNKPDQRKQRIGKVAKVIAAIAAFIASVVTIIEFLVG